MTESLTPIIFRFLNFGIIVGGGFYLYKRYGKDALRELFQEYKQQKQALKDEAALKHKEAAQLAEAFEKQRLFAETLARNVIMWRAHVAEAIAMREQEKIIISSYLQQKSEKVARAAAWLSVRRACLEKAIAQATHELTLFYADTTKAQSYIHTIVSHLEEHRS